jgi:hypothetical protein
MRLTRFLALLLTVGALSAHAQQWYQVSTENDQTVQLPIGTTYRFGTPSCPVTNNAPAWYTTTTTTTANSTFAVFYTSFPTDPCSGTVKELDVLELGVTQTVLVGGTPATVPAAACPATTLPYTEPLAGETALNPCLWQAVIGPASSSAPVVVNSQVTTTPGNYGVASFIGLPQGSDGCVSAVVNYEAGSYPALAADQDSTGRSIALEPSLNAIYYLETNSGAGAGGAVCNGSNPIRSGDVLQLCKTGTTYTARDITANTPICSVSNPTPVSGTFNGYFGVQVDDRSGTSTISNLSLTPASTTPVPVPTPTGTGAAVGTTGKTIVNMWVSAPVFVQQCDNNGTCTPQVMENTSAGNLIPIAVNGTLYVSSPNATSPTTVFVQDNSTGVISQVVLPMGT